MAETTTPECATSERAQTDRSPTRPAVSRRTVLTTGAALLALPLGVRPAAAQNTVDDTVDIAAARKEGRVTIYTSAPIGAAQKVASSFEAKYAIKVELFRSGGTEVLRRFMMERDAGFRAADVLVTSDPSAAIELAAKGAFVPFRPAGHDTVPAAINDADGRYIAQRISLIANYLRADLVQAADYPRAWSDLARPKYKGRLVMTDPSYTSLQLAVTAMLSKLHGWKLYEALQNNDILIVKGNEQALGMLKRGERHIAIAADSQYANEARLQGHNIEIVLPEDGTFAIPAVTAIVNGCPSPNAAKLLAEYLLSAEAQRLWPASGIYAARSDIAPPEGSPRIADARLIAVDYVYLQAQSAAIKKKFGEIFS